MQIIDVLLLGLSILVIIGITYGIAYLLKPVDPNPQKNINQIQIQLLPVEHELLKHYEQQGYVIIAPRQFGGINGDLLRDGVKFIGPDKEDVILDKYFYLFDFVTKPISISFLLNK